MTRAILICWLPLSQGKFTKVDKEDFELLNQWKWSLTSNGYAKRVERKNGKQAQIYLHRFITNCPKDKDIDHINRHKLDNRKSNLRQCVPQQDAGNMKHHGMYKYKGVTLSGGKRKKKWAAQISIKRKNIHLGRFYTQEEAALAYNEAALKYFKEFARLNLL